MKKNISNMFLTILLTTFIAFPASLFYSNIEVTTVSASTVYHEGVNKTVNISNSTTRMYISKSTANNLLKTGSTVSIVLPGGGKTVTGIKWVLAMFGIWSSVKGGFYFDSTKTANYYSSHTPWFHNFNWQ
ncbi:hypothetical protein [Leuconostoc mesenteroides]|uniref:hypothetical protein n=2 Tax=Leuconostoc mesenteroides TaxID=1245 RepID=UPI0020746B4C|nr:hypothetical protein [Leuconostoc mesenteroides]MCM6833332.1 hypothetical protein [Leuconostoc mesenteroides]